MEKSPFRKTVLVSLGVVAGLASHDLFANDDADEADVGVLNVYNQENVSRYEYAPNGKKLISPPPGYGRHVPVTKTVRDEFFPSIGFEVQFK